MNKVVAILFFLYMPIVLSAASYTDNTYQKLANEYVKQAQKAKRAGDYEAAIELAAKAKENAELSRQFIDMMLSRDAADENMAAAKERMDWAEANNVSSRAPAAYAEAKENYTNAQDAYSEENYDAAAEYASRCIASLLGIKERPKLPEYYVVRPWERTKDCFWNIAAKPFVYNNPFLWRHLYNANKGGIPIPANPNLILPAMTVRIPSINGEEREGVYDPQEEYGTYGETE